MIKILYRGKGKNDNGKNILNINNILNDYDIENLGLLIENPFCK